MMKVARKIFSTHKILIIITVRSSFLYEVLLSLFCQSCKSILVKLPLKLIWQQLHILAHFSPTFQHPQDEVEPLLQLHDINVSNDSVASFRSLECQYWFKTVIDIFPTPKFKTFSLLSCCSCRGSEAKFDLLLYADFAKRLYRRRFKDVSLMGAPYIAWKKVLQPE